MKYKYMEKQVEGTKALAEKYPNMQTHQDIYKEHVEVLKKAHAFDEISKYVKRKLSAEVPLDDDYLIGRFESYETIQELMEDEYYE